MQNNHQQSTNGKPAAKAVNSPINLKIETSFTKPKKHKRKTSVKKKNKSPSKN
jgi:hypothetical protein